MSPKHLLTALLVLVLLLSPGVRIAHAATTDNGTVSQLFQDRKSQKPSSTKSVQSISTDNSNFFIIFLKLIVALAIVIALIYLLYRFVAKRTGTLHTSRMIKNIGGVALGGNRSVQLIQVGQHVLVVGVGDSVHLIQTITDPVLVSELTAPDKQESHSDIRVFDFLKETLRRPEQAAEQNSSRLAQPFADALAILKAERAVQIKQLLQEVTRDG
ncbi:MAG: flagellar biosynthetic protein FliO [Sporolactobacillus sp.]